MVSHFCSDEEAVCVSLEVVEIPPPSPEVVEVSPPPLRKGPKERKARGILPGSNYMHIMKVKVVL